MSILWRIDYETDRDWRDASQRARTRALKAATLSMAMLWRKEFLRLHFQPGNATRYGYAPRKPNYLKKKARAGSREKIGKYGRSRASFSGVAGGGVIDLVYRGLLRRRILQGSTVQGYPTRATVTLRGPDYFTTRPRKPPNMAREILTIIDRERTVLRYEASTTFYRVLKEKRPRGRPKKIQP